MHQAHGIGYEAYSRKFEERLKVEQRREMEYKRGRLLVAEVDRRIFT
ncbi:hypothetical protein ACLM5H_03610 [Fredinandcohnia humi]